MLSRIPQQIAVGNPIRGNRFRYGSTNTGDGDWGNCTKCRLHQTRRRVVIKRSGGRPGHTKLLFIGEAPGQLEDVTGEPFVGTAGKILHQIFKRVQFQFHYTLTNSVCCRPVDLVYLDDQHCTPLRELTPGEDYELHNWNRDPTKAEMDLCRDHIHEIVDTYDPEGIVYLGKVARSYKTQLDTIQLEHPAYIARMEYKLVPVLNQARMINDFIRRLRDKKD